VVIKLKWTIKQIEILKSEYLKKGEHSISSIINKSPNAIRIKASRMKIYKLSQKENIKLSTIEEQVILGGILGDLCCRITKTCKNARIEGAHCRLQEPYLFWKVSILKNLSFIFWRSKLGQLRFQSKTYPILNHYYDLFYRNGKKEVDDHILEKVDEFGLAIWYMDDGSYIKRDRRSRLYTNGFSYNENIIMKGWFESKWNISPKIYSDKKPKQYPGKIWFFLQFNAKETQKLFSLIKDYIHPSMKYKIGVIN